MNYRNSDERGEERQAEAYVQHLVSMLDLLLRGQKRL